MAQGGQGKEGTGRDSRWPGRVGRDSERGVMGGTAVGRVGLGETVRAGSWERQPLVGSGWARQ